MENGFEIQLDATRNTERSMTEVLGNLTRSLEEMAVSMESLSAKWDGPAHDTARMAFARDYNEAKNICQDIQKIIDEIEVACRDYSNCENEVASVIRAIRIGG